MFLTKYVRIYRNFLQQEVIKFSVLQSYFYISVTNVITTKAAVQTCSVKKVFLEISQNSQENTCTRLWHRCFPLNFVKFLRTSFFIEHL